MLESVSVIAIIVDRNSLVDIRHVLIRTSARFAAVSPISSGDAVGSATPRVTAKRMSHLRATSLQSNNMLNKIHLPTYCLRLIVKML